jgi:hypothetical protein
MRKKEKASRHIRLQHWMLHSPAWRSLSTEARALYVQLAMRYIGTNNGRISYSVREGAEECRIGKSTAHRALNDLVDRGFMVATKHGAFSLKHKHASEWRLTEFNCDVTLQAATKDFMKWTPKIQNTVPVAGLSVPVAGPFGTGSGTVVAKIARNGTCSGTVNAQKSDPRYLWRDTSSIPGGTEPESAPAPSSSSSSLVASIRRRHAAHGRRRLKKIGRGR